MKSGYEFVHFGHYTPTDLFPFLFDTVDTPRRNRKEERKARVKEMNQNNPRYWDLQVHYQRIEDEAKVCQLAMLCLYKYRHDQPVTQKDYDNLVAATRIYNQDFEPIVPEALVEKVAKKMKEVV